MDKKKILIIVALIIVIAIVAVLVVKNNNTNDLENQDNQGNVETVGGLNLSTSEEMIALVADVYEGLELFSSLATSELDITDIDALTYATGLTSTDKIDAVISSEPMMSSQAYSMVLVKVKDPADADSIAKEMSENINPNKWICVSAEKVYATSSGNIAFLVMSNAEMAESVFNNFKSVAGTVGQEYVLDNTVGNMEMEDEFAIPAL